MKRLNAPMITLTMPELQRRSSDPAMRRKSSLRSLVRQTRIDEPLPDERTELAVNSHFCTSSSEQSIALFTHQSSVQSATPIGDCPPIPPQRSVIRNAVRMMSLNRHPSMSSQASDGRTHVLLHNVGRTIQRTGSQLRKTRIFHLFYLVAIPVYTCIGAWIFQRLDGYHDDRLIKEYEERCDLDRTQRLQNLKEECNATIDCFSLMKMYLEEIEQCYRKWHLHNRTMTHSMSNYTNALVYAFSVYTTIGYGNMAAETVEGRIATIFYGALGIPLFFAFVKEEGNLFRNVFISVYKRVQKMKKKACQCKETSDNSSPGGMNNHSNHNGNGNCLGVPPNEFAPDVESGKEEKEKPVVEKRKHFTRKYSAASLLGSSKVHILDEQRKVFIAGCVVFLFYIFLLSLLITLTTEFDYFTSVYFLFNSVALIGFGDVFPGKPSVILIYAPFMILGVVLFSMCYFILQEEIREKAFEASRKARISISKYGHSIIQQARSPWSRRNSPLFDQNSEQQQPSSFERHRKRRQSAPAIALTAPGGKMKFRDI